MKKQHIFEHEGVLFGVEYTFYEKDCPTIHSVRVLGPDYKVAGPDLAPILHKCLHVYGRNDDDTLDVEAFLSMIAGELKP